MLKLITNSTVDGRVCSFTACYLGLVRDRVVTISYADENAEQVPVLQLTDGTCITHAIVISKYLASLTRLDVAESLYSKEHQASSSPRERIANQHLTRWYNHIQHLPGIHNVEDIPVAFVEIGIKDDKLPGIPESSSRFNQADRSSISKQSDISAKVETMPKETQKKKQISLKQKGTQNNAEADSNTTNGTSAYDRPIEDVTRLEIRVGLVHAVQDHPEADKLYCEEIDIGEARPRKIVSGLKEHLSRESLEGQKVLVLCNMKEKKLRGVPSHGMVLCGKIQGADGKEKVELVQPPENSNIGELITFDGLAGKPDPVMNTKNGKNPFAAVQPSFTINRDGVAYYKSHKFITSAGDCICRSIREGGIS